MTTKLKGMVVTIFLVLSFFSPLFADDFVVPEGYICIKETELEATIRPIIEEEIRAAVEEAVAIVVKEEEKKRVDLQASLDAALVTIESQNVEIKNLKRDQLKNIIAWGGGGVAVGFTAGVVTLLLIQAGK